MSRNILKLLALFLTLDEGMTHDEIMSSMRTQKGPKKKKTGHATEIVDDLSINEETFLNHCYTKLARLEVNSIKKTSSS